MVEMYFSGDSKNKYPMLSFSNIETHVTKLIASISESLVKFRNILPHSIISKYENNKQTDFQLIGSEPTNPNVSSLYLFFNNLSTKCSCI